MEKISSLLNYMDSKDFMGREGFVWWYGVVEDRKDPLYLGRVKVRCIGFHTDDKELIPTEDLPWAQIISPIHSAGISGIGFSPTGLMEGSHVFGFFRDGVEAQEPVVLGSCVGIPGTISNPKLGFSDPRTLEQRKDYPYPPFFVDRYNDGKPASIIEFKSVENRKYLFDGENGLTDKESFAEYHYDADTDKAVIKVYDKDRELTYFRHAWSPNPKEDNFGFDSSGKLAWSLPSTPLFASTKIKLKENNAIANPISEVYNKTNDLNVRLNEARRRLHSDIESAGPVDSDNNFFDVPSSNFEPEYPFNHITYTESGHIFELDDTPKHERIRILHRTHSFLEFDHNGDRYDNTVGNSYKTIDASEYTHIIGTKHINVGGSYNIYINSRKNKEKDFNIFLNAGSDFNTEILDGSSSFNIGGKNKFTVKSAGCEFNSNESAVIDDIDFSISKMNFNVTNAASTVIDTGIMELTAKSDMTLDSAALSLNSLGTLTLSTVSDRISMISLRGIDETITATPLTSAKTVRALFGDIKYEINQPSPLNGFFFDVGPNGSLTGVSFRPTGMTFASKTGDADFKLYKGKFTSTSAQGAEIKDGTSVLLEKIAGAKIELTTEGLLDIQSAYDSLSSFLEQLLNAIIAITVPTGTGPSGAPINSSQFEQLKQQLSQILV